MKIKVLSIILSLLLALCLVFVSCDEDSESSSESESQSEVSSESESQGSSSNESESQGSSEIEGESTSSDTESESSAESERVSESETEKESESQTESQTQSPSPLTPVSIMISNDEIYEGKSASLTAGCEPLGVDRIGLVWSSSDPSVATVEANPTYSYMATVTGVKAGNATITVTAPNGKSTSVSVTVIETVGIPVELYVNGELWKTVYTSATDTFRIPLDELDPVDITTSTQSTQYFVRWYKTSDFSGLSASEWDQYEEPSKLYAKMLDVDLTKFIYTDSNGELTITGYNGTAPEILVIPSEINGKSVKTIAKRAFMNMTTIERVHICEGVEKIEMQAFLSCSNMYDVSIPNSIEQIDYYALPYGKLDTTNYGTCDYIGNDENPFLVAIDSDHMNGLVVLDKRCKLFVRDANMSAISQFTMDFDQNGVGEYLSVDENGVLYNKDKTKLVIMPAKISGSYELPATVTEINEGAFEYSSLESVSVAQSNTAFDVKDGVLYTKALDKIIFVPSGVDGKLEIPATVTSVDYFAFSRALYVTEITFLGNIESLDRMGFGNCTMLEKITIENSDTYETRDGVVYEKGSNTAYITPRAKQ